MRIHEDERRRFVALIEWPTAGDVNIVTLYPGHLVAWHRHQRQDDYGYVISGIVRVGIIRPSGVPWCWTRSQGTTWSFPRRIWHGYEAVGGPATFVTYITQHYDPRDEERHDVEEEGAFAWPRLLTVSSASLDSVRS